MSDDGGPRAEKKNGNGGDLEDVGDLDDLGFGDEFDDGSNGLAPPPTLGDMWRENPLVKVVAGVAAVGVIALFIMFMSDGGEKVASSTVPLASQVTSTPGTEELPPEVLNRYKGRDNQDRETAIRTGTSALPTILDPADNRIAAPQVDETQEDPLERWRAMQAQRQTEEAVAQPVMQQAPQRPDTTQATQQLAGVMSEQMAAILEARSKPAAISQRTINSKSWLAGERDRKTQAMAQALEAQTQTAQELVEPAEIIIPTGEIEYAQMVTEANSDVPGPVLVDLASGPLAGARLLGDFKVHNDRYLALEFKTIVINGVTGSVDAIALDPSTTLPGMATEIDNRYFKRIVLPAAAAFLEGMAGAAADTVTQTTVSNGTVIQDQAKKTRDEEVAAGIEELASNVREELDRISSNTPIMVKIHAGTPIGILFLEPVVDADGAIDAPPNEERNTERQVNAIMDERLGRAGKKLDERLEAQNREMEERYRDARDEDDRRYDRGYIVVP